MHQNLSRCVFGLVHVMVILGICFFRTELGLRFLLSTFWVRLVVLTSIVVIFGLPSNFCVNSSHETNCFDMHM